MSSDLSNIMTLDEAAQYKGVHPQTIKRWHYEYNLRAELKGHTLIFHKADLDAFTPPADLRAKTPQGQDKHIRAYEMYEREGKSMAQIAAELGYKNESGASRAVQYGRDKIKRQSHKKK